MEGKKQPTTAQQNYRPISKKPQQKFIMRLKIRKLLRSFMPLGELTNGARTGGRREAFTDNPCCQQDGFLHAKMILPPLRPELSSELGNPEDKPQRYAKTAE